MLEQKGNSNAQNQHRLENWFLTKFYVDLVIAIASAGVGIGTYMLNMPE